MWTCRDCDQSFNEPLAVCPSCGGFKTLKPASIQTAGSLPVARPRGALITAKALAAADRPSMPLSAEWRDILGSLPAQFGLLVYGAPGSGKSHWLMRLAAELSRFGKVLYIASESGQSNATIGMLNRLEVHSEQVLISSAICTAELLQDFAACTPRFLIVDSVTCVPDLSVVVLSELCEKHRIGCAFSLHVTKSGTFRGESTYAHWCDIVACIDGGKLRLEKNRFGPLKEISLDTTASMPDEPLR